MIAQFMPSVSPAIKALVVVATLLGIAAFCLKKGIEIESNRRDAEDAVALATEIRWADAMLKVGQERGMRLQAANLKGQANRNNIKVEIHDSEPPALVTCPPVVSSNPAAGEGAVPSGSGTGVPIFTHRFVGLWDAGWTGRDGEPLFPYRPGSEAAQHAPSAVTPAIILNVHTDNAEACSADRRRLDALIDRLDQLERDWDRQHAR